MVLSASSDRPRRQLARSIRSLGLAAIVALSVVTSPGWATARQQACTFATSSNGFGPGIVIQNRRRVSCTRAKGIVRDYIRRVHAHYERDHVVDGFYIRLTRDGQWVANRPGDHARFTWRNYGEV